MSSHPYRHRAANLEGLTCALQILAEVGLPITGILAESAWADFCTARAAKDVSGIRIAANGSLMVGYTYSCSEVGNGISLELKRLGRGATKCLHRRAHLEPIKVTESLC